MSKLFKLKSWLELEDAAKHLSNLLSEDIRINDLKQLASEGNLSLSVLADSLPALPANILTKEKASLKINYTCEGSSHFDLIGREIPELLANTISYYIDDIFSGEEKAEAEEIIKLYLKEKITKTGSKTVDSFNAYRIGTELPDNYFAEWIPPLKVVAIQELWDLHVIGSSSKALHENHSPPTQIPNFIWLTNPDRTEWACVHDTLEGFGSKENYDEMFEFKYSDTYFPARQLPAYAKLVIKTTELQRFVSSLGDFENELNLTPREETTYLNIIGGLLQQLTSSESCNQAKVQAELLEKYPQAPGMSKSNLDKKFAAANKSIKEH
jgi:hypothetical protein